jgi:diguanylate cyclase (GGDEF)-like protein
MLLMQKEYAEWKAKMIASHDELTGLPNRRHFYEQMLLAIDDGKTTGKFGAVILFDLDNFKILNDSHGHSVGDALLRQAAARIRQALGTSGTAARLGGDEFVILLTNLGHEYKATAADARAVAEGISQRLAETYTLDKHNAEQQFVQQINHRCTGSFGIKIFNPLSELPGQILHHADQAMYEAKNQQKGSICLFQS